MQRNLQVFISSTFIDLKSERQAAVEAVLAADHIPAGMELWASNDETQLETIRRWIDMSDVFIIIVGGRYGTVDKKTGKSYTQLEYEYAIENKKSFSAFVMSKDLVNEKIRQDPDMREQDEPAKLRDFTDLVLSRTSKKFATLDELRWAISNSLNHHARNSDLKGWVRGEDVIDPKRVFEDMSRLQGENRELQDRIKQLESEIELHLPFDQPFDPSKMSGLAKFLLKSTAEDSQACFSYYNRGFTAGLMVGDTDLLHEADGRAIADWDAAIKELKDAGLVAFRSGMGSDGDYYQVTKEGFALADSFPLPGHPNMAFYND